MYCILRANLSSGLWLLDFTSSIPTVTVKYPFCCTDASISDFVEAIVVVGGTCLALTPPRICVGHLDVEFDDVE